MTLILAILTGAVGSIIGAYVLDHARQYLAYKYLRHLFNFGSEEPLFVVPHRVLESNSIMPRVAVEDVLAMKNILFIGNLIGWKGQIRIRDVAHLSESDKKHNIVTFGGTKVNPFTKEVLASLPEHQQLSLEHDPVYADRWVLRRGNDTTYHSGSYEVTDNAGAEVELNDVAAIVKLKNPHNPNAIVIAIAGMRGIGTWGAADCLRKCAKEIYSRKRRGKRFRKSGEFIIVVSTRYKNFDIVRADIKDFIDLS
jgi:hypothetical protein